MKLKINVYENVTFEHEVTIEVPNSVNIEAILDKAERADFLDDVLCVLKKAGCKIMDVVRDESGTAFIEIPDLDYEED